MTAASVGTGNWFEARIYKNSTIMAYSIEEGSTNSDHSITISVLLSLTATDTVKCTTDSDDATWTLV